MRTFQTAARVLGTLEEKIMEVLWEEAEALSVRDVAARLRGPKLAYTTVMTTLDRLYRKGLAARTRDGNAFLYRAAMTRDDVHRKMIETTVTALLAKSSGPVLAAFVDTAATLDRANLERLTRLIEERRRKPR